MTEPVSKFEQNLTQTLRQQQPSVPREALDRLLTNVDVSDVTNAAPQRYLYNENIIHKLSMPMQNIWKIAVPAGLVAVATVAVVVNIDSFNPTGDANREMATINASVNQVDQKQFMPTTDTNNGANAVAAVAVASEVDGWMAEFEAENQEVLSGFNDTDMLEYDSAESSSFDSAYNDQEI